jgi:hypothetical protein
MCAGMSRWKQSCKYQLIKIVRGLIGVVVGALERILPPKASTPRFVLLATNIEMWKFDGLVREMNASNTAGIWIAVTGFGHDRKSKHVDPRLVKHLTVQGFQVRKLRKWSLRDLFWLHSSCAVVFSTPYRLSPLYAYAALISKPKTVYIPYSVDINGNPPITGYGSFAISAATKVVLETEWHKHHYLLQGWLKKPQVAVAGFALGSELSQKDGIDSWGVIPTTAHRIVWAPHWTSVRDLGTDTGDDFKALFDALKQFADKNPDNISIFFRPHPLLRQNVIARYGSAFASRVWSYFEESAKHRVSSGPGYAKLFRDSDVMIHNSGSFMAEYVLTGKPTVMWMNNGITASYTLNEFGKTLLDCHYQVGTCEELVAVLSEILFANNDTLKYKREKLNRNLLMGNHRTFNVIASEIILERS